VPIVDEVSMSSYTDSEQYASAVLHFKAKGVTRVQFVDVSGLIAIQFLQHAESQQFRPRYVMTSANSLAAVVASAPRAQLHGSIGIGWMPSLDVDTAHDPGRSRPATLCLDVVHKAGYATADRISEALALWTCESMLFFRDAMSKAPQLSASGLAEGAAALGNSYVPATTFATRFARGRYDGASAIRPLGYDDGCGCFVYTGPAADIG
jgi:hypothetical protein